MTSPTYAGWSSRRPQDDARDGSRWLELQVDPTSYAVHLGGLTPTLEIIQDAARNASAATGVTVVLIVAASRMRHPLDARTLARLAVRHAGDGPGGVVGFGLSNDERRGDTAEFAGAFRIARRAGLASVPHSGELLGRTTCARRWTTWRRTGSATASARSRTAPVLDEVVDRGITLEVCPGSNVALGVYAEQAGVPLRALRDAGARLALGADDPLLFGSRLADQYRFAREQHGFDDEDLAELARDSIRGSRAPDAVRARAAGRHRRLAGRAPEPRLRA